MAESKLAETMLEERLEFCIRGVGLAEESSRLPGSTRQKTERDRRAGEPNEK